jgi:hypothetical protein
MIIGRAFFRSCAFMVLASTAAASPDGGATLHYELSGVHAFERDVVAAPPVRELVLAGARLNGFVGPGRIAYHAGLALAAGGTIRAGGFAYDVALFPIGAALRLGETSFVTLGAGIGANGAVGTLDDALALPIEARLEIGRGVRLLARARVTFVQAAPARAGQELEGMLALRLGRAYDEFGFPTGNGYFVGAAYRDLYGARFAGLVIGYSIDMATRPARRHAEDAERDCPKCD